MMTHEEATKTVAHMMQQHAAGENIDIGSFLPILQFILQLLGQYSGGGTPLHPPTI